MAEDKAGMWAYVQGEHAIGEFESWQEAVLEATQEPEDRWRTVEVGELEPPVDPVVFIDDDLLLDHVCDQDDYTIDCAEAGWPNATKEQLDELTNDVQKAFGDWLDRHKLRPNWKIVRATMEKTRADAMNALQATEGEPPC